MFDCDSLDINSGFFPRALNVVAKLKKIPIRCIFELTPRCNLNCRMCYVHLSEEKIKKIGRELTNDEWLKIAEQAKESGVLYLTLTGGEIFTRPGFRELYEKLSEMGFLVSLMTNGTMIDESVIEWLRERPPYSMSLTIYGSSNEVYEAVCGVKSGFDRFDRALTLLKEIDIPIEVKTVLIKSNEHDFPEMFRYIQSKGIRLQHTYGVVKSVRGAVSDAAVVRRRRYELSGTIANGSNTLKRYAEGHGPYHHHSYYLDDCGVYGNTATVTWNGHMIFCTFTSKPFVDLLGVSFSDAWAELMAAVSNIKKPNKCSNCKYEEYCLRCPGSIAAETGSYEFVTEDYCMDAKYLYSVYNDDKIEINAER